MSSARPLDSPERASGARGSSARRVPRRGGASSGDRSAPRPRPAAPRPRSPAARPRPPAPRPLSRRPGPRVGSSLRPAHRPGRGSAAAGAFGIGGTGRGSASGAGVARTADPVGEPQCEQKRAALPYSSPQKSHVPPTPGWNTIASGRGAPSAVSIAAASASRFESRSIFAPITAAWAATIAAAAAVDLVEQPAEVAQHQLTRPAQVAQAAAQPAAPSGRGRGRGLGRVEPGGNVRVGPDHRRGRLRRGRQLGRPGVAGGRGLGRRGRPLRPGGLPLGRGLAGVGGARALDASQESAHGLSRARSPMRSKRRV